jgi:transcriptional regulator with XRE-family HTH domain
MSLGINLRRARRAAEMTQEQLAVAARVDRGYISDLEHDKQSPTVAMLFRLCDALGVRASEILACVEATRTIADDEATG